MVGVMASGFAFPGREQLWTPLRIPSAALEAPEDHRGAFVGGVDGRDHLCAPAEVFWLAQRRKSPDGLALISGHTCSLRRLGDVEPQPAAAFTRRHGLAA